MTFTEAAMEILRRAGRPLHFKTITEIAMAKNMLSHIGKSPELTMSTRLAMMVKNHPKDGSIIKVRPGVFGLREFSADVLAMEPPTEFDLPDFDISEVVVASDEDNASATSGEFEKAKSGMPGADIFPVEDDDDEPLLGGAEPEEGARGASSAEGGGAVSDEDRRGRRRRRKRRGGGGVSASDNENAPSPRERPERGQDRNQDRNQDRTHDRNAERNVDREPSFDYAEPDSRLPDEAIAGRHLADAIASVFSQGERMALTSLRIAEVLVRKGRLEGDARALAPTVAAAVRADNAKRATENARPRFRFIDRKIGLVDWWVGREVLRCEQDTLRMADRQREQVRRAFLKKMRELPAAGFVELLASWLNAEGVSALRAVRRPNTTSAELHLAGVLRRDFEETRLAVVAFRDGREITRERIAEVRGSLHHYGNASEAWIVTTGTVRQHAREEAAAAGTAPFAVFDGFSLGTAMERLGIGIKRHVAVVTAVDFELLDALRGSVENISREEGFQGSRNERNNNDRAPRERHTQSRGPRHAANDDREISLAETQEMPRDQQATPNHQEVEDNAAEQVSENQAELATHAEEAAI